VVTLVVVGSRRLGLGLDWPQLICIGLDEGADDSAANEHG